MPRTSGMQARTWRINLNLIYSAGQCLNSFLYQLIPLAHFKTCSAELLQSPTCHFYLFLSALKYDRSVIVKGLSFKNARTGHMDTSDFKMGRTWYRNTLDSKNTKTRYGNTSNSENARAWHRNTLENRDFLLTRQRHSSQSYPRLVSSLEEIDCGYDRWDSCLTKAELERSLHKLRKGICGCNSSLYLRTISLHFKSARTWHRRIQKVENVYKKAQMSPRVSVSSIKHSQASLLHIFYLLKVFLQRKTSKPWFPSLSLEYQLSLLLLPMCLSWLTQTSMSNLEILPQLPLELSMHPRSSSRKSTNIEQLQGINHWSRGIYERLSTRNGHDQR